MSTSPELPATPPAPAPAVVGEIRVYSHSALFYWWPVWAVGLLMGLLTVVEGRRMVVVPRNTPVRAEGTDVVLSVPVKQYAPHDEEGKPLPPRLHMAESKTLGVLFATVLLLVIFVSNVPLRGLWSLIIVLLVVLFVVIIALAGWWGWLVEKFALLDVRINAGGYFFISVVLLIIWAVTVFIFDHRTYVAVTPGQVRVCLAVGAGETVYDTTGMTFEKHQNDLFRHWIIGLGSGDLVIHRSNTNQEIDMPNVLFIGAKVKEIEQLIKERKVV